MTTSTPDELVEIRSAVAELCGRFPGEYWRSLEPDRYPEEFVRALTEHGWLAALIPTEYGGAGLGLTAASVILEEINASGGNAAACHAQMYTMGTLLRHGSEEQKQLYLPRIASGDLRLQAFGVTEPTVGSDTTRLQTSARRVDGGYVIRGQKIWTSRALHSDLMLLLARTTPFEEVERKSDGISVFLIDMQAAGQRLSIRPVATMMNHATTEVFLDDVEVPADALVGEEGQGFGYILDGMNAERILLAAEWNAWSSGGRSARTRACSSRLPARTPRSRPPTSSATAPQRSSRRGGHAAPRRTWPSSLRRKHRGRRQTSASTRTAASGSRGSTTSSGSSAKRVSTPWRRSRTTSYSRTSASTCSGCRARTELGSRVQIALHLDAFGLECGNGPFVLELYVWPWRPQGDAF